MKLLIVNGTLDGRTIPSRHTTKVRDADVVVCAMGTMRRTMKNRDQPIGAISGRKFAALKREATTTETIRV